MSTAYTVYHPLGLGSTIAGGVAVSARQQRKALDHAGVQWTADRSEDYDIVHLNFLGPVAMYELLRAHRSGIPVVVHAHSLGENIAGTFRFSDRVAPAITRYYSWMYRQADTVIAVSNDTRRRLKDQGVSGHIPVVSNGVDADALDGVETQSPDGTSAPTVVNLAQVYDVKGIEDFIDVGRRLPDVEFRWYGDRHPWLIPRSTRRRIEAALDNVEFPGYIEDKRDAFAVADVFFFPSHRETQGLSLLEAAYCRCAIVTRDIPVFDYLEDGIHCLKGDSPAVFADQISTLLSDSERRTELGANAHDFAVHHTLDQVGDRLRAVYDATLNRENASP